MLRLRPSKPSERLYFYANTQQIVAQTGLIGHLRGDFGPAGNQFFSTFFDAQPWMKTDTFKAEFDRVVNTLRRDPCFHGVLCNRDAMAAFCKETASEDNTLNDYPHYGYRIDTDGYAYLLRCFPLKGDYNFYLFCYNKQLLDDHLRHSKEGIRFVDSSYKEKFRVADGAMVRLITHGGENRDMQVRYVNAYHFETHAEWGTTLYHICEFAERFEKQQCMDIFPMPKSNEGMTHAEFIALIGKDIVVDYPFGNELQRWSMKNFYVDDQGQIRHKRITDMLTDGFVAKARNPHWGKATHG